MSIFEPNLVHAQIRNVLPHGERAAFDASWEKSIAQHLKTWNKNNNHADEESAPAQFQWAVHVVEYVSYLYGATRPAPIPRKKGQPVPDPPPKPKPHSLRPGIPIFGPRFVPPSYLHLEKRSNMPTIEPEMAYLKAFNIIHLFYYPQLAICPRCCGKNVGWEGWTSTGPREVYSVRRGELALGCQIRCKDCQTVKEGLSKEEADKITHCTATTNALFWEKWQYWEVPQPWDPDGYNARCISSSMITDILLENSHHTRKGESEDYLRTLTARTLSLDATFKASKKASLTGTDQSKTNPSEGGPLTAVTEHTEVVTWKLCQLQANAEMSEMLGGLKRQHDVLEEPPPEQFVTDNCCHVMRAILSVFPGAAVGLDVWHAIQRYLVSIVDAKKNPYRLVVAEELRDAILIKGASKEEPARYWTKEEQEEKLNAVYTKWARRGGVWMAAALKVHVDQMKHVRKGCLTRRCQDVRSDGSCIEGSHKGWNSIMRSHASGLETFVALGHDFVLRRNIRIASSRADPPPFVAESTFGSHHIRLASHGADLWNSAIEANKMFYKDNGNNFKPHAEMRIVNTGETFGLEEEEAEEDDDELLERTAETELMFEQLSEEIGVDPSLFIIPDPDTHVTAPAAQGDHGPEAPGMHGAPSHLPTHTAMHVIPLHARHPGVPAPARTSAPATAMAMATATALDPQLIEPDPELIAPLTCSNMPVATTMITNMQPQRASTVSAPAPSPFVHAAGDAGPVGPIPHDEGFVDLTYDDDEDDEPPEGRQNVPMLPPPVSGMRGASSCKRKATSDADAGSGGAVRVKKQKSAPKNTVRPVTRENGAVTLVPSISVPGTAVAQGTRPLHAIFQSCKPASRTSAKAPPTVGPTAPSTPSTDAPPTSCAITSTQAAEAAAAARSGAGAPPPRPDTSTSQVPTIAPGASVNTPATDMSTVQARTAPLTAPLPVPQHGPRGLSRSQHIWAIMTNMDPRSLEINWGIEFFTFMKLRAQHQWASFSMTTRGWTAATPVYNTQLALDYAKAKIPEAPVEKHPRALLRMITKVEKIIISHMKNNKYASTSKDKNIEGDETFWRRECHAVPGLVPSEGTSAKGRKPQACQRCNITKYGAGVGGVGNHRRSCCSDGAPSRMDRKILDKPPPWPQPEGIYVDGKKFHVMPFLDAIKAFYETT
ncbi:hypothetical protein EWM64_g5465, partial [Hericium alpestre]